MTIWLTKAKTSLRITQTTPKRRIEPFFPWISPAGGLFRGKRDRKVSIKGIYK
jgi:hypothetical protein